MDDKTSGKHGGARTGAGRKSRPDIIQWNVRTSDEQLEKAKRIGNGKRSLGV